MKLNGVEHVVLILIFVALMVVFLRGYTATAYALKAKGYYDGFGRHIFMPLLPLTGLLLAIPVAKLADDRSPRGMLMVLGSAIIGCVVIGFGTLKWVQLMRPAPRRMPRKSKVPYGALALVSLAAVPIAPGITLLCGGKWSSALRLIQMSLFGTAVFYSLARRQAAKPATQELQEDPRAPVLYIRSFVTEAYVFARTPKKGIWRYWPIPEQTTRESGMPDMPYKTFEEYLGQAVRAGLGPMVGLGSPCDRLPQEGAAREYCVDQEWQEHFAEFANKSSCILASADLSSNLQWELAYLRENGLSHKLFLCTAPDLGDRVERSVLRCWGMLFGKHALTFWGLLPRPWAEIARQLQVAGYCPPQEDPGPGCVLGAGPDGRMVTLARAATSPEQYVNVIRGELAEAGS